MVFCPILNAASRQANSSPLTSVVDTQTRRAAERFSILDFIRYQQSAVNSQNARYGRGASQGPTPDLVLSFQQDSGNVLRDGATIGRDFRSTGKAQFFLNSFFKQGDKNRSLNVDLGVEGYASQTTGWVMDPSSTQDVHKSTESGGGLLIRTFGRSSQDTGLLVKGGYMDISQTGFWATTNTTPKNIFANYVGAEAKLYLVPFLGGKVEYQTTFDMENSSIGGTWKMQRLQYGAFLEVYLLNIGVYAVNTEFTLTPSSTNTQVKEIYNGAGVSGTLYF